VHRNPDQKRGGRWFVTLVHVSGGEHGTPSDGADPPSPPLPAPPPAGPESEWSINWAGAGVLLVVVVVVLVGWRPFGAGSDDATSSSADVAALTGTTTQPPTRVTTSTVAPTTVAPTTVARASAPTTTVSPERRVLIEGEIEPCRFGDRCLVASFTLEGFEQTSGEFVCIYPNSSSRFSFSDGGRDDACLTADEGDTIAIEVDGVRSDVISEENLTGGP
jgi:hypothetical protein